MATLALNKATVVGTISGNASQEREYPESASLASKLGEFCYLDANGRVAEIGDNPSLILGMTTKDGENTTADLYKMPVALANGDTIFSAHKTNSSGNAIATALTDVGKDFGLYRDTTNNLTHIHPGAGTNNRAICIGLDARDAVGDVGGRLLFMIKGAYRQLFSTS